MPENQSKPSNPFALIKQHFLPEQDALHLYNNHVICVTDSKGNPNPDNKSLTEIVVDSSNGFIPLWKENVTLNWRFSKSFGDFFADPRVAKTTFKQLFGEAVLAWKDACPVKFHEDDDAWDFEITMRSDNCNDFGCVLASAFFPQQGRDELVIYPKMFEQGRKEQVETLIHELGHIFGLRHFFAKISETNWPAEIFGKHDRFSIMNYENDSILTDYDISDLKRLYQLVWSGALKEINTTRIVTFDAYHTSNNCNKT